MIDCLILGDSIAVGTHQFRQECVSYSKGGWNSWQWNRDYLYKASNRTYDTIIISLGANDHRGVKTEAELLKMRDKIKGKRVFWILPAGNHPKSNIKISDIQEIVKKVADQYGDVVLPITRLQPDGIHPSWAGYKELAEKTK
jgi:lysophospholipase L1-like esterase